MHSCAQHTAIIPGEKGFGEKWLQHYVVVLNLGERSGPKFSKCIVVLNLGEPRKRSGPKFRRAKQEKWS